MKCRASVTCFPCLPPVRRGRAKVAARTSCDHAERAIPAAKPLRYLACDICRNPAGSPR